MKKIRILQFPIANSQGGITKYILENWKWIDKERFHFDFATMSKHLDFAEEILALGSQIFYISCYAEDNREQFAKEFDVILSEGYDVVHLHTKQWKGVLVEEICKKHNIPKVIVHAHNCGIDTLDLQKRNMEESLHERVKRKIDKNIATDFWACSKQAADFLFGEQIPKDKIKIMPNAIDLNKFVYRKEIRDKYRNDYGLENNFVIGHIGRFAYQKNHEFLVNVFKKVLEKKEEAMLLLVGEGELMPKVKEWVGKLGIENKVLFLGKREDVNCWCQVMDIFCLPSRFEGLGIAMIEAQAAGLPCIGSENIPREVETSPYIKRLPLEVEKWVEQIWVYTDIERGDNMIQLKRLGYDICSQIKIVEKLYVGGGQ